ncbi:unnamed protein product, partial [Rotaria magnacalcarata]
MIARKCLPSASRNTNTGVVIQRLSFLSTTKPFG